MQAGSGGSIGSEAVFEFVRGAHMHAEREGRVAAAPEASRGRPMMSALFEQEIADVRALSEAFAARLAARAGSIQAPAPISVEDLLASFGSGDDPFVVEQATLAVSAAAEASGRSSEKGSITVQSSGKYWASIDAGSAGATGAGQVGGADGLPGAGGSDPSDGAGESDPGAGEGGSDPVDESGAGSGESGSGDGSSGEGGSGEGGSGGDGSGQGGSGGGGLLGGLLDLLF